MPSWTAILVLVALGAAGVLWYGVATTKQLSDWLLDEYGRLLERARAEAVAAAKEEKSDGQGPGKGAPSKPDTRRSAGG